MVGTMLGKKNHAHSSLLAVFGSHTAPTVWPLSLRRGLSVITNIDLIHIQWTKPVYQSELGDWGFAVLLRLHLLPFWLLLLARATSNLSSYSTAIPHQILTSTEPSCYRTHLTTYHCLTTPVPSHNQPGTRPLSRLIRLLCGQVSPTAIIQLDYWSSLRRTAATGCTPSPWLHVEQDSTTRQYGLKSNCAWESTCVNLICAPVEHSWMPRAHTVYPASAVQADQSATTSSMTWSAVP